MSLTALLTKYGGTLDIEPAKNEGMYRFILRGGKEEIVGYVSPKVAAKIDTVSIDDLQYCETLKPDRPEINPVTGESNWVPCLMMVNRTKVIKSFSLEE